MNFTNFGSWKKNNKKNNDNVRTHKKKKIYHNYDTLYSTNVSDFRSLPDTGLLVFDSLMPVGHNQQTLLPGEPSLPKDGIRLSNSYTMVAEVTPMD